jgi:hypothetical protein
MGVSKFCGKREIMNTASGLLNKTNQKRIPIDDRLRLYGMTLLRK